MAESFTIHDLMTLLAGDNGDTYRNTSLHNVKKLTFIVTIYKKRLLCLTVCLFDQSSLNIPINHN